MRKVGYTSKKVFHGVIFDDSKVYVLRKSFRTIIGSTNYAKRVLQRYERMKKLVSP